MKTHVMLDLETLGTRPGYAIVSIGAVEFDPFSDRIGKSFYTNIDLESSLASGFKIDAITLQWWFGQSESAREAITKNPRNVFSALEDFEDWLNDVRGDDLQNINIWGNGATFDNVLLKEYYLTCGMKVPWTHRGDMCFRTFKNTFPVEADPFVGTTHKPVDDCINQIKHLQKIFRVYGLNAKTGSLALKL